MFLSLGRSPTPPGVMQIESACSGLLWIYDSLFLRPVPSHPLALPLLITIRSSKRRSSPSTRKTSFSFCSLQYHDDTIRSLPRRSLTHL